MRYRYKKLADYSIIYGSAYICGHPVYNRCTPFILNDKGREVIQQRYERETKTIY